MATALFRCLNAGVAHGLGSCMSSAPVGITGYNTFEELACIVFVGDCAQMYWWCMSLAEQSNNQVAFVGIDENSMYADDPYQVFLLGNIPPSNQNRLEHQSQALLALMEKFMYAAMSSPTEDAWLKRICHQCVLGGNYFGRDSAIHAYNAVKICENQGRQCNYRFMLDSPEVYCQGGNTMVLVMAHLCYLCASNKPNSAVGFKVRNIGSRFRGLFG